MKGAVNTAEENVGVELLSARLREVVESSDVVGRVVAVRRFYGSRLLEERYA